MRFAPIVFLVTLLHAYLGWRLIPALAGWPAAPTLFAALLVVSAITMPASLVLRRARSRGLADALSWLGMLCMGLFSSLLVLTLLRDLGLVALGLFDLPSFSAWSVDTGRAVVLSAFAITAIGVVNARRTAAVKEVEVPIANLPPALHGFTIAQISDLHVGPTIKRGYVQAVVDRVNALDADMVAVTGDVVDGTVDDLADHVAPLAHMRSRHGSFFVTGNHEYYSGAAAWIVELRRLGLKVLLNEHVMLPHDGASLLVGGVTDYGAGHFGEAHRSDPQGAMAGAPSTAGAKLLLAHQPRSAVEAERAGFDLQLSGHTHGGQFLPWNLFVPLQQPFVHGLNRLKRLWIYTSRGTGYWGPPLRFGAPSEITRLTLVPAAA